MRGDVRQARTAVQTPEQTPEGPVPFHLPTPFTFVNRPVPLARRGPATPLILVAPEPEMRPARKILCITNLPLVAEMWPPLTAMPMLITPQWPLVVRGPCSSFRHTGPPLLARRNRELRERRT